MQYTPIAGHRGRRDPFPTPRGEGVVNDHLRSFPLSPRGRGLGGEKVNALVSGEPRFSEAESFDEPIGYLAGASLS